MTQLLCPQCHPSGGSGILDAGTAALGDNGFAEPTEGDIYCLAQTVYEPIHRILHGDPLPQNLTPAPPVGTASATSAATSGNRKRRPCLIEAIEESDEVNGQSLARIYAMATYDGKPIETTNEILQHFSIGVSPHAKDRNHIHTVPEWQSKEERPQWIIAFSYSVPMEDVTYGGTRFSVPIGEKGASSLPQKLYYRVSPSMRAYLRALSAEKQKEWQAMCQSDRSLHTKAVQATLPRQRPVS